jgi:putative SOS response-associated peptidase YedK
MTSRSCAWNALSAIKLQTPIRELPDAYEEAKAALKQYPEELMVAWPVSTRVNSPKNNGPELIATVR